VLVLGGVILLGAGVGGYWFLSSIRLGEDTDSAGVAEIEARGHFRLPASARDVKVHIEGFQDWFVWVRFEMLPVDEGAFWGTTRCAGVASVEGGGFHMNGVARPWWNPSAAKVFRFREWTGSGIHSQRVMIDRTNPAMYTVYVETLD
jgi:hypothetical protein